MGIKLIVGLGNPGQQYQETRHNAGVWFLQKLTSYHNIALTTESKFKALLGRADLHSHDMRFCVPLTFMNLSGDSVATIAHFYKIVPEEILVAHDELDLPVGTIRLKFDGGHGGNNGVRDVIAKLQTKRFYRLRIGIGKPSHKDDGANYVLSKPSRADRNTIDTCIDKAIDIMPEFIRGNIDKAMQALHTNS
ncbi:MAG TPA: aminoacyl-tRNA hydrolase [Gammaproteobacteria bacterium]|nr:aminoacyl-tRNA hydrolase [Gammaproteobacteria bacterium]